MITVPVTRVNTLNRKGCTRFEGPIGGRRKRRGNAPTRQVKNSLQRKAPDGAVQDRSNALSRPDSTQYRRVMGRFPTGVTVVTTFDEGGAPVGLTASSLTSVSLDPLYLLVCLGKDSRSHDAVIRSEGFAVNVLGADAADLSTRFATVDPLERFEGVRFRTETTGAPVLERASAWLDCRVAQLHDAGDHTIVVGEVLACDAEDEREPLVYLSGAYRRLEPA